MAICALMIGCGRIHRCITLSVYAGSTRKPLETRVLDGHYVDNHNQRRFVPAGEPGLRRPAPPYGGQNHAQPHGRGIYRPGVEPGCVRGSRLQRFEAPANSRCGRSPHSGQAFVLWAPIARELNVKEKKDGKKEDVQVWRACRHLGITPATAKSHPSRCWRLTQPRCSSD